MPEITYHYDDSGKPVAIEVDGERRELTAEDANLVPDKDPTREVRDLQVNIRSTIEDMKDSYSGGAIIVDIEATHFGYFNNNRYNYLADGGKKSHKSWTKPYGKPYIVNHDMMSESRGRVVEAKFVKTGKDTGYHALDTRIGHKEEVEMILDSRALTVSVGSNPVDTVECSNCSHDLYHDGNSKKPYTIDTKPDEAWLKSSAPGIYGMFGMSNEDFWEYKQEGEGKDAKHWVCCRHVRGMEAPRGGKDFEKVGWYLHEQAYREVSRVNIPADQNEATGEYAHIRGVLKQTDGLDPDTRAKHLVEALSRVDAGSVDRARFNVVSERDLFRPVHEQEAIDYANATQLQAMFDTGQWLAIQAQMDTSTTEDQVKAYYKAGGRFIGIDLTPSPEKASVQDALGFEPRQFGRWLRAQDSLSKKEKASLDAIYTHKLLGRLRS